MALVNTFMRPFMNKGFLIGVLLTAAVYGGSFVWADLASRTHLENIESTLASQTIPIQRISSEAPQESLDGDEQSTASIHGDLLHDEMHSPHEDHSAAENTHDSHSTHQPHNNDTPDNTYPIAGLFETESNGNILPTIRESDGMTPFKAYSRAPEKISPSAVAIALVIDNVGLSPSMAARLQTELPPEITFLTNPYASNIDKIEKDWHEIKREIWLKIPFESADFPMDDPGIKGILTRASLSKNMDNLTWALSRAHGYSGIAASVDSAFLQSRPLLGSLAKDVFDRGLGFFEMNNAAPPIVKDMAERQNKPYIRNEIMLQDPKWNGDIGEAAGLLETIAESKGYAIGIMQPYPETIEFVKQWSSNLERKNITLVPLSAIYIHKIAKPQNNANLKPVVTPAQQTQNPQPVIAPPPAETLHDPAHH